jgi:predicted nucleic acid-binding Zn ribbon protein
MGSPMTKEENCPNCSAPVQDEERFCSSCGQKNRLSRLNTRLILMELIQSVTETKGLPHLVLQLIRRPGIVAREYVGGKRKSYFHPFNFLILVVGITSMFLGQSHIISHQTGKSMVNAGQFMDEHANIIIFLNVPILAFYNWKLFARSGYNFAEHLVLVSFLSGLKSMFFSVLVLPCIFFFSGNYFTFIGIYMSLWMGYFTWANCQFLNRTGLIVAFKSVLVPVLTQISTVLMVVAALYLFSGKQFLH